MRIAILILLLMGCSGEANHLGNPLTWPVSGAATALSNATYQARRDRVSRYLERNHTQIQAEARTSHGAAFAELARLARISASSLQNVHSEIAQLNPQPFDEWVENATIIAMVYGQ